MRISPFRLAAIILFVCFSIAASAQNITITGNVRNSFNQDLVPAVSVTIKNSTSGTFTDERGNFRLVTNQTLPLTLVFTSIGFEAQEVTVTDAATPVQVSFNPVSSLGTEVVVSASRVPERILESPVSIERVGVQGIRRAAVPNYYEGMANLKGVDLTTSSLTFRTISTRGFNGSGNLRFNQLVDGMDNQAPGLNFPVGNIIGITELDVDNVELLQGASSALYGSGGMNGTLLMTSKDPFKYQGLSFQIKQGVNHIDGKQRPAAPYYDWSLRWGKKITEKFAFKISGQFISAKDWQANDTRNLQRNNVFSEIKPGTRQTDPNYDGVNVFGDEASASMNGIAQVVIAQASRQLTPIIVEQLTAALGRPPTPAEVNAVLMQQLGTLPQTAPFYHGLQQGIYGSQVVSRTGYNEVDMVDYNTYNVKVTGGLYYKINPNLEASLVGYWGTGTTVYTGADRYALKNLIMAQYKAELRSKNWFLRAYTTQENSGDSYAATLASVAVNRAWKSDLDWFLQYTGNYSGAILTPPGAPSDQAHAFARSQADAGRFLPGSPEFVSAFNKAITTPISKGGAQFADKTDLYHFEGQYNFSEMIKVVDILVGANYRIYSLNSQGTIFSDTAGRINISEYGGYIQLQKRFLNDVLKITASARYDKHENFEGRFTPRATALVRVAPDNNIRLSFQTAYRFPSAQDQYINLQTPASRLIGGLPEFETYFHFDTNPAYTAESVTNYRASIATGTPNPTLLEVSKFTPVKPETVNSYEIGYRGLLNKRFLIDAYAYLSEYNDFIARVATGRGVSGDPAQAPVDLASPFTTENYSFVTNSDNTVKAYGWGISGEYQFAKGFELMANVSSDQLRDVPANLVTFFNTPKWRYNLGLSNDRIAGNWGFNVLWRWQDKVLWEGTFGTGEIPAFGTIDAQVSYKLQKIRSIIKLGGSNILNDYYYSAFGNPQVGGVYYVSFGYNVF